MRDLGSHLCFHNNSRRLFQGRVMLDMRKELIHNRIIKSEIYLLKDRKHYLQSINNHKGNLISNKSQSRL